MRLRMTRKQPTRVCMRWLFVRVAIIDLAWQLGTSLSPVRVWFVVLARPVSVGVACACMQVYVDFWVFVFAVYIFGAVVCYVSNYWLALVKWGS